MLYQTLFVRTHRKGTLCDCLGSKGPMKNLRWKHTGRDKVSTDVKLIQVRSAAAIIRFVHPLIEGTLFLLKHFSLFPLSLFGSLHLCVSQMGWTRCKEKVQVKEIRMHFKGNGMLLQGPTQLNISIHHHHLVCFVYINKLYTSSCGIIHARCCRHCSATILLMKIWRGSRRNVKRQVNVLLKWHWLTFADFLSSISDSLLH